MAYFSHSSYSMKGLANKINQALIVLALAAFVVVLLSEYRRKPMTWQKSGEGHRIVNHGERPLPFPVPDYFRRWRASFVSVNRPYDQLGLVRGIFLGDSSAVEPQTRDLFSEAGLSHLLSANGLKCWIIAMTFKLTLALTLHLFSYHLPAWLAVRARRLLTPLSRLCGTWLFWLWTNQTPAITRAVLLVTTKYTLDAFELRVSFARLLVVQFLCSLVVAPELWHSPGFQLTYGCLAGIIWFPRILKRWRPLRGGIVTAIWDYFSISMGAILGGLPCSILMFDEINFMSLTTNWFMMPLITFAIMPLGLAQMALLTPGLGLANHAWSHTLIEKMGILAVYATLVERTVLEHWIRFMPPLRWP